MKPLHLSILVGAFALATAAGITRQIGKKPITEPQRVTLGVRLSSEGRGKMVVQQVTPHGSKLGFQVGDRIVEVENSPIRSNLEFVNSVAKKKSGDKFRLLVERDGTLMSITRRYEGPMGVTRMETAASQGIEIRQVARNKSGKRKRQVQTASVGGWFGKSEASKAGPPQSAPEFVKPADWIEL